MTTLNTVVYAKDVLGPNNISVNTNDVYASGFTTILLGLFHIGRGDGAKDPIDGQKTGDIIFNNPNEVNPKERGVTVISDGELVCPATWPNQVKKLLKSESSKGNVTAIGCSVGGWGQLENPQHHDWGGVEDYRTIWGNFIVNGKISKDTALYKNFAKLKEKFPAISFIDFDCEEFKSTYYSNYSWTKTLIAFGNMLKDIGFDITFCPFDSSSDWMDILQSLYSATGPTVRWMNLQCYDGGGRNDPADWTEAVTDEKLGIDGASFIVPGLWCCNTAKPGDGSMPNVMQNKFACWRKRKERPVALRGGFIWNYDDILAEENSGACGQKSAADYQNALAQGLTAEKAPDNCD